MRLHQCYCAHQWQHIERTCEHIILGILGTIFTIYAQKIEGLVLGSQWLTPSMLLCVSILLAACRYRRQMIQSASWCPVRIRNLELQGQRHEFPALSPVWWDLAASEEVSPPEASHVWRLQEAASSGGFTPTAPVFQIQVLGQGCYVLGCCSH